MLPYVADTLLSESESHSSQPALQRDMVRAVIEPHLVPELGWPVCMALHTSMKQNPEA